MWPPQTSGCLWVGAKALSVRNTRKKRCNKHAQAKAELWLHISGRIGATPPPPKKRKRVGCGSALLPHPGDTSKNSAAIWRLPCLGRLWLRCGPNTARQGRMGTHRALVWVGPRCGRVWATFYTLFCGPSSDMGSRCIGCEPDTVCEQS